MPRDGGRHHQHRRRARPGDGDHGARPRPRVLPRRRHGLPGRGSGADDTAPVPDPLDHAPLRAGFRLPGRRRRVPAAEPRRVGGRPVPVPGDPRPVAGAARDHRDALRAELPVQRPRSAAAHHPGGARAVDGGAGRAGLPPTTGDRRVRPGRGPLPQPARPAAGRRLRGLGAAVAPASRTRGLHRGGAAGGGGLPGAAVGRPDGAGLRRRPALRPRSRHPPADPGARRAAADRRLRRPARHQRLRRPQPVEPAGRPR